MECESHILCSHAYLQRVYHVQQRFTMSLRNVYIYF